MADLINETPTRKIYRYVLESQDMLDRFNKKHNSEAFARDPVIGDTVQVSVIKKFNKNSYDENLIKIPEWMCI